MSKVVLNQKYNMLTVIKDLGMKPCSNRNRHFYLCKCDCGKLIEIRGDQIGKDISCGCDKSINVSKASLKRHTDNRKTILAKHDIDSDVNYEVLQRLRDVWSGIKRRCNKKNDKRYQRYGGRGIKVCKEWENDLYNFVKWSLDNGYEEHLTIDRINNDGNYEPSNCRWANDITQCRNRSSNVRINYNGKDITLTELSEKISIPMKTLFQRYHRGDRGEQLIRPLGIDRRNKKGSENNKATINEEQALKIKKLLQNKKLKQTEIAKICNTSSSIVNSISKGRTWKHIQV